MSVNGSMVMPLPPKDGDGSAWQIAEPGIYEGFWQEDLGGLELVTLQIDFRYGTGSGGVRVCIQSSLDQGDTAYDLAVFDFTNTSRKVLVAIRNASIDGFTAPGFNGVGSDAQTESEGIICSVIGDRLRANVLADGTYQNTTLSIRAMPV